MLNAATYSTATPSSCSLTYKLTYPNGTDYTSTSYVNIDLNTGILSVVTNEVFSIQLSIKVTSPSISV